MMTDAFAELAPAMTSIDAIKTFFMMCSCCPSPCLAASRAASVAVKISQWKGKQTAGQR
jgi:hypothetical protein